MKKKINQLLLSVILLELMIGGSGRFLEIGSITARMVLYVFALIYSLFLLFRIESIKKKYIYWSIVWLSLLAFYSLLGLFNNAELELIFEDFKQLSYFPMIVFFSLVINNYHNVIKVTHLIKLSAVILLAIYFAVLLALQLGFINFNDLYNFLSESDQFAFRGDIEIGFFYRGFIVLCIGLFFFLLENKISSKIISFLLFIGIILTFTRGFIYSTIMIILAYFAYLNLKKKNLITLIFWIILPSVIAPIFFSWFLGALGSKEESDSIRIEAIQQVLGDINPISLFIGHGFGTGVPIRPIHMEISYLEIFHKQGLLGLIIWASILFILIFNFQRACRYKNNMIARSFFLSSIFVFLQSVSNPYINNPIGMSIIIISMVCLDVLSNNSALENNYEN